MSPAEITDNLVSPKHEITLPDIIDVHTAGMNANDIISILCIVTWLFTCYL